MRQITTLFWVFFLLFPAVLRAEEKKTREQKVREDQQRVVAEGFWIYNDLPLAFDRARESGKPLLVVLRCIPCEECVKLDDDLVDADPVLRPLLEKFVCVRVVSTNGLDLSLFQFDTDQSFAAFMLNADRTIYGRFGTRSHRTEWVGDVSLAGLAEALRGALDLHQGYPGNQALLTGKTGPAPPFERPELAPSLKDNYTSSLNYAGEVVKSCIHCHQIGDAIRDDYRRRGQPIPEEVLSPYPHPRSLGMILDPATRATLKAVTKGSLAEQAGLLPGDQIGLLNSQPILSMADVQWVLQSIPAAGGKMQMEVVRKGTEHAITLELPEGWRRLDDISWRVSSWGLRRMVTGGLFLVPASEEERKSYGLTASGMALRVKHVGQYGPHAAGKQAGFQTDDIILSYDGRTDLLTDSDVLRYGMTKRQPGDTVAVEILRGRERKVLTLPMQE